MKIIIENTRFGWMVDKDASDEFTEKNVGYEVGALITLEVSEIKPLCHHPDSPVVCSVCG